MGGLAAIFALSSAILISSNNLVCRASSASASAVFRLFSASVYYLLNSFSYASLSLICSIRPFFLIGVLGGGFLSSFIPLSFVYGLAVAQQAPIFTNKFYSTND